MYDIYSNANDDQWRFTLGRCGSRPLLTIGLNPSTATQERADPTVARVERIAEEKGFGGRFDGFVMLNLYPVRATDFRELPAGRDETRIHHEPPSDRSYCRKDVQVDAQAADLGRMGREHSAPRLLHRRMRCPDSSTEEVRRTRGFTLAR